jgi:uncharacterized protein
MKKILLFAFLFVPVCFYSQEISDEYKNETMKFFELTKSKDSYLQVVDQLLGTYQKSLKTVPDEFWDSARSEFRNSVDEMLQKLVPIYYKYYTLDDLKQLNEFYKSPLGQKVIDTKPMIMKDSYDIGLEFGKDIANRIMEKLKNKGYLKT